MSKYLEVFLILVIACDTWIFKGGKLIILKKYRWIFCPGCKKKATKKLLEKALEAILTRYGLREEKIMNSLWLLTVKKVDFVKQQIERFIQKLDANLLSDSDCDEVYQLSIAFYPLTRSKK